MATRIVELRRSALTKNNLLAAELRMRFQRAGVLVVNLFSNPGSGKSDFLQRTLQQLRDQRRKVAALIGDEGGHGDAFWLGGCRAPVRQIDTHGHGHLKAEMVASELRSLNLREFDFLFIENARTQIRRHDLGRHDLGEDLRVALWSVTEGEDKPAKNAKMFATADVAIITKMDLAAGLDFDVMKARRNLRAVRPKIAIFETSAKTGQGMQDWIEFLLAKRVERRGIPAFAHTSVH